MPKDKNHFSVVANVEISDLFFGWICGFGKRAKIESPPVACGRGFAGAVSRETVDA